MMVRRNIRLVGEVSFLTRDQAGSHARFLAGIVGGF